MTKPRSTFYFAVEVLNVGLISAKGSCLNRYRDALIGLRCLIRYAQGPEERVRVRFFSSAVDRGRLMLSSGVER